MVLVRAPAPLEPAISAAAEHAGIAVVLADPEVSWSHLTGLAYGLVLEGRETESGRGPTDLFALADTLAAALRDSSVVIEDQLSRVLAYSSSDDVVDTVRSQTILGRRLPDRVRELFAERGVFRHLAASDEPLFVEPSAAHGFGGRMVIAVRAGRELLGSLWVETAVPFDAARRRVLEDGARTAALHLLRSRASADLERQVESDLVTRLIEGIGDAPAMISQLGLPRHGLRVVALQAHVEDEQHAGVLLAFEHVTTGFGWSRPGRSALFANTVYTLLPAGDDTVEAARDVAGGRCAAVSPPMSVWWPGSAVRPRPRCCRPAAARPTSAWHCTPLVPSSRPWRTTSRGTASCSAACGPSPPRAACPSAVRWPSSSGTTDATGPTTSRRCGPGWPPTGTSVPPRRPSTSTRTPSGTASGRWTRPLPSPPITPTSDSP